uniref:Uncharacterized protein n=1 Tax=Oryza rufipogon TaxID=4529 RepID=A0A0E0QR30_ORYRU
MGLDVRDGDFFIVGRVFSLPSVSPFFGRTLFLSWGMLGGGWRLRLTVEVYGGWMAFRGWQRVRLCRWLQSRCWRNPCRAFGRFDNDGVRGCRFPPWRHCHGALSYPHKSPGENLVPIFGRAAAASRVVSSLGASLRRSSNASMTADGFAFLGPLLSYGGRHALRLFLLMKSKLLADGGAATLGNDDMLQSLLRSSGAGRVKEVAPRWLG